MLGKGRSGLRPRGKVEEALKRIRQEVGKERIEGELGTEIKGGKRGAEEGGKGTFERWLDGRGTGRPKERP